MKLQTVLVVDDDPDVHEELDSALKYDFEIEHVYGGEEAIALLTSERGEDIDVILLDIDMPNGTCGWETLQIIRDQDNGWPDLKVIMVSSRDEAEGFLKAMVLGADSYICKVFDVPHLLDTIKIVLKGGLVIDGLPFALP